MTHYDITQRTEQPDRIHVEIDRRFDVTILRTVGGLEIRVYPRTEGELWDVPFDTFTVDEQEIIAVEEEIAQ